ncbi:MAG: hypothetical protein S4CHLAM123_09560 [Chlamydiales bacterium]|nr:hypothetical protein [Chlamydiales bacterium]
MLDPLSNRFLPNLLTSEASSTSSPNLLLASNVVNLESENHTILSKEKLIFCYKSIEKAVRFCVEREYNEFDALTATTCCHGVALLVRRLLLEVTRFDLDAILHEIQHKITLLESDLLADADLSFFAHSSLPYQFILLTQLHILKVIKVKDLDRGWLTCAQNLKMIYPIGTRFCVDLVKKLRKYFSNYVAESYMNYADSLDEVHFNDVPIKLWKKYVQPEHIRVDWSGRKYASCMYSMQIVLCHLMQSKAKIVVTSDLRCEQGKFRNSYIQVLQSKEGKGFVPLNLNDEANLDFNMNEPVVVFGGCTYSDALCIESLRLKMDPWMCRFPSLVLACDILYPQFPMVREDSNFDYSPIRPKESQLKAVIAKYSKVEGVSSKQSSLFCLAHIYTASLKQVLQASKGNGNICLSDSFIPSNLRE